MWGASAKAQSMPSIELVGSLWRLIPKQLHLCTIQQVFNFHLLFIGHPKDHTCAGDRSIRLRKEESPSTGPSMDLKLRWGPNSQSFLRISSVKSHLSSSILQLSPPNPQVGDGQGSWSLGRGSGPWKGRKWGGRWGRWRGGGWRWWSTRCRLDRSSAIAAALMFHNVCISHGINKACVVGVKALHVLFLWQMVLLWSEPQRIDRFPTIIHGQFCFSTWWTNMACPLIDFLPLTDCMCMHWSTCLPQLKFLIWYDISEMWTLWTVVSAYWLKDISVAVCLFEFDTMTKQKPGWSSNPLALTKAQANMLIRLGAPLVLLLGKIMRLCSNFTNYTWWNDMMHQVPIGGKKRLPSVGPRLHMCDFIASVSSSPRVTASVIVIGNDKIKIVGSQ